ncbi:SecD/SecF/SecDF export membrane protein [Methanothermus fervidus DSM 2088]|uniref:Protein-export membrane protein SecD n=1 Tax=Methanothermus fervidus (strain ATCC 43054 / DSM 2088 / JCM 10308 / V24 S) TaxID=523846 RepID=E3GWI9_METFV|nr:preprotein translocase subunit SecD [Methanothermus fervidus]ADP77954.1 SecD/SecF/SecDF export membrane protein [Methanothermus fervidus DSM 2088]
MNFTKFIKEPRVLLLIILTILSIISITVLGIQQGLDLKGGSLVQLQLEKPVDKDTMNTVVSILDKRLNVFGIKDVKVRPSGNQYVLVEIAGVQPEKVTKIIGTPGKFEAKIGNEVVFTGADIVSVQPPIVTGNKWQVPFRLSPDAAKRFADIAKGKAGQPVKMYLDDRLITSPEISPDVAAGKPVTEVEVSGYAPNKEYAEAEAKEVETILKAGTLPVKVKIVGIDNISPELGKEFSKGAVIAGALAIIAVSIFITIRYRNIKLALPIILTSLSEVILVLGVASVIRWNIDLPAIAGILAVIGTGVDDQIIITDEVIGKLGAKSVYGLRHRIRNAFFIIFASAGTFIAAMFPLAYVGLTRGYTGVGVLSGFAFTTVIGVLIGVFITRPVFAKYIEYAFLKK